MFSQKNKTQMWTVFSNFLRDELLPTELPEAGLKELVKMANK